MSRSQPAIGRRERVGHRPPGPVGLSDPHYPANESWSVAVGRATGEGIQYDPFTGDSKL